MILRGINSVNLDSKGRLVIPTRYRELLIQNCLGELVVTIDTKDPCLLLYPEEEWDIIQKKITQLSSFQSSTRRIQRLLIGHATDVFLDNNGRILLSQLLREYAQLNKKCILLGQGNKFEIWNESIWNECRDNYLKIDSLSGDIPDELQKISL